jgi:hypothetical protein
MGKLEVVSGVLRGYLNGHRELYYNYKLSMLLLVLGGVCFVLYGVLGTYSGLVFFVQLVELVLFGHIILSVMGILNDYIFDVEVKVWCKGLWLILSLRVLVEILFW